MNNPDYTPWSDEEEATYEAMMHRRDLDNYKRELAEWEKINTAFEADGGDISIQLEDQQSKNTSSEDVKESSLSSMQSRILEAWKDYP